MHLQSSTLFKAALAHFHPEGGGELLRYLPLEEAEQIRNLPPLTKRPLTPLFSQVAWIAKVHYSWLEEFFLELPKNLYPMLFSLLNDEQKKGLEKLLKTDPGVLAGSPLAVTYLAAYLKKRMMGSEVLPEEFLRPTEMHRLLELSKVSIVHLISLLGVYDLAADLRQVVDRMLLGRIYSALSKDQRQFLDYSSKQAIKWMSPRLNLQGWDGNPKTLQNLLHERGLFRFAKSLEKEEKSFQWHVLHRLDRGRGQVLARLLETKPLPTLTAYFKDQVIQLAKRYPS